MAGKGGREILCGWEGRGLGLGLYMRVLQVIAGQPNMLLSLLLSKIQFPDFYVCVSLYPHSRCTVTWNGVGWETHRRSWTI